MSTLTLAAPAPNFVAAPPVQKRFTVVEFHKMWEDRWFENSRPMLVNGRIYEMAIPGPLHNSGVGMADYTLKRMFGDGYWVRIQMPLVLSQVTDPVPDLAVVLGSPKGFTSQPTTALLVIEVSDSSLKMDLGEKALAYAAASILDYWVVDVNNHVVVVHRDPHPDPASDTGFSYSSVQAFAVGQSISPLAVPRANVGIADLLP